MNKQKGKPSDKPLERLFYDNKRVLVVIILIIVAASISFILLYQYSNSIPREIVNLAIDDIKSNSKIQSHAISHSLANSVSAIISNLRVLSNAPSIHNSSLSSQTLFDAAQESTKGLTEGYYWLDREGKVITYSQVQQFPDYRGVDLSSRDYFKIPRDSNTPYFSSVINSTDKVQRVYISYPIIGNSVNGSSGDNSGSSVIVENNISASTNNNIIFEGVIVAALRATDIGKFLQAELLKEFPNTAGLIDRNGVILYSQNQSYIGKNYFGNEFQSIIPIGIRNDFNAIIESSLEGDVGLEDFTIEQGNTSTVAYNPVVVNGDHIWTLYIVSPHQLAENVYGLINKESVLSIIIIGIIIAIAGALFFIIMSWNRTLRRAVSTRTQELKDTVNQLLQANEQLKVHDKMQKEFINVASHEMKTPTQAIIGYSDLMQKHPDKREEMLKAISRNAVRLQRLTNDILDVTRIESQTLKLDKEKFNLSDLIANVVEDQRSHIEKENQKIKYNNKYDSYGAPIVDADRDRITQVISNLLGNAIKFTSNQVEGGSVSVSLEKKHNNLEEVTVNIRDTGEGIHQEILPRLFTKFATKSFAGTGLGLYISKSIIEEHGGRMWAQNNSDGQGATFTFTLPLMNNNGLQSNKESGEEKK
ncbi:MAG: signal transduction histidine kinase, with phosphoacceptor and binding domain [Nitrososphaeraceae archaeon]|jgi:signal transduction histidine kinase|nr:signal transduction histidine kinase, with phosphoacceptor and binding domain [Nitrososphaeraceae archaeon]